MCVFFVNLRVFSSFFVRFPVGGRTKTGPKFCRFLTPKASVSLLRAQELTRHSGHFLAEKNWPWAQSQGQLLVLWL